MIEIKNVTKSFDGQLVLDNVCSKIGDGSIYGLIGSNGAGKSTLLNIIDGIYRTDAGGVYVNGAPVYENTVLKNKIAYISDEPYFYNSYTIDEMAQFLSVAYPSFTMEKYKEIISSFPLDPAKKMNTFSKGMKRQAAIALALSQNPEMLLCDECFDGLDPVVKQLVKRIIINEVEQRGMTVVISSHNLIEMENLCDTIGILHNNTILVEKSLDSIKGGIHKFQLAFKPMIDPLVLSELDILSVNTDGYLMELVVRGDKESAEKIISIHNPLVMQSKELTLEDIFIYEMEATGYDFSKILL